MITMTLDEFKAAIKAQNAGSNERIALKCPMCKTVQSGADLIAAGAGKTFDEVESFLGFSCVGRFTRAGEHKRGAAPGRGCNWTLGGLLQIHELEVVTPDGRKHPRFKLATAEEAAAHKTRAQASASEERPERVP